MFVIFNPLCAMLVNTQTKRFHPIFFREAPLPGPPSDDMPVRHKSFGHHTVGFDTREAALASIQETVNRLFNEGGHESVLLSIDDDIAWDGNAAPAISTCFFEPKKLLKGETISGVVASAPSAESAPV